jgi:hypothetical protein
VADLRYRQQAWRGGGWLAECCSRSSTCWFARYSAEYQAHYNNARPHQGIAQRIPAGERDAHRATLTGTDARQIRRKPVLGGLIHEYTHAA